MEERGNFLSIEAARAGEQGRGFAVVATEIGSLANETEDAVKNIQKTISEVQTAFENLAENADSLLKFVSETVAPDYHDFVDVAMQYGKDAENINEFSETLSEMSNEIKQIIIGITEAIQSIAESTQETAGISATIVDSVDDVSGAVEEVSDMSEDRRRLRPI